MEKKIDVIGQMILAVIPIIVTPLYAFYRIKKFKKGVLVMIVEIAISLSISTVTGDLKWGSYLSLETGPFEITQGFVVASIVDILFPLYFVRKWTLEYNEKIDSQSDS